MAASLSAHGLGPADGLPQPTRLTRNYSYFTIAWITGSTSVIDSAPLGKRGPLPRASSRGFSLFQLRAPGPRRFVLRKSQKAIANDGTTSECARPPAPGGRCRGLGGGSDLRGPEYPECYAFLRGMRGSGTISSRLTVRGSHATSRATSRAEMRRFA